ncbi:MAG: hypothetical protein AVDCRST_MAG08-177, partial [uncultured Acetobacteraceae bacterium]
ARAGRAVASLRRRARRFRRLTAESPCQGRGGLGQDGACGGHHLRRPAADRRGRGERGSVAYLHPKLRARLERAWVERRAGGTASPPLGCGPRRGHPRGLPRPAGAPGSGL